MKTGIFGGTFNPVHYGHLRSAEETRQALNLDRILFIPCHLPPHKGSAPIASPASRLRMLALALEKHPFFELSDIEIARGGTSYSFETLRALRKCYGEEEQLFFIIGTDSFLDLGTWRNYGELFAATNFVVVARPGYLSHLEKIRPEALLPVDIRDDFCYDSGAHRLEHISGRSTYFLETTLLDISSTKIRDDLSKGLSIKYLLPSEVEDFIRGEGLYSTQK